MKLTRQIIIPALALALSLYFFSKWTQSYTSFTIFSYTLKEADPLEKSFPDIDLLSHHNKHFKVADRPNLKLINFVYLNCPYVCHKINNQLEEIYHQMDSTIVPSQLEFITISFDLEYDDVERIRKYRSHFGEHIDGWTFALPYKVDEQQFFSDVKNIGVWIYRDPITKLINHSVNLFLVDANNKIIKIFDPNRETNEYIIQQLKQCLNEERMPSLSLLQ
ncbi:MAG: SCO family protein [Crocinitomicaceae bacterium]|nr:SCO family protein [Crocinitomicaceae bacterium]